MRIHCNVNPLIQKSESLFSSSRFLCFTLFPSHAFPNCVALFIMLNWSLFLLCYCGQIYTIRNVALTRVRSCYRCTKLADFFFWKEQLISRATDIVKPLRVVALRESSYSSKLSQCISFLQYYIIFYVNEIFCTVQKKERATEIICFYLPYIVSKSLHAVTGTQCSCRA